MRKIVKNKSHRKPSLPQYRYPSRYCSSQPHYHPKISHPDPPNIRRHPKSIGADMETMDMERDFFRRRFIGWSFRVRYRVVGDVGDTVPLFPSCLSNLASGKIPAPPLPFFFPFLPSLLTIQ